MSRQRIGKDLDRRIREAARNRCGYCLSPQELVFGRLEIEHITPLAVGGTSEEANLWLACRICNGHKSSKVSTTDPVTGLSTRLFNPRADSWKEHFHFVESGLRIEGLTAIGRATVVALHLADDPEALQARALWIKALWYPPED